MKNHKLLKGLLLFFTPIILFLVCYSMVSFILFDMNVQNWSLMDRVILVIPTTILSIFADLVIVFYYKTNKKL